MAHNIAGIRLNDKNLRILKDEIMSQLKLDDEQWKVFRSLVLEKSWEDFHDRGWHPSFAMRDYIDAISEVIDGFGAESLEIEDIVNMWYVNTGDGYNATVLMNEGKLYYGTWADVAERYL